VSRRPTILGVIAVGMAITAGPAAAGVQADSVHSAAGVRSRSVHAAAGGRAGKAHAARAPSRLLVYAQEWSLWPSRPTVAAGRVIVQLWNRGQDAHNLQIRRLNAHGAMVARAQGEGIAQTGQIRIATWTLGPGTYELYCSMPGHLKAGMHSRITIR
jgi:uncharacterized cupredoxin-like copper-binding protein